MLSPEVWNFKTPVHSLSIISDSSVLCSKTESEIANHYFNHSVAIILPDTVLVPEDLNSALTADSVYYKVDQLPISRFLDKQFIDSFVKKGELTAVSVGTHIDTEDCAAVTPTGHLVLNLLKETYQTLGLQGTQSCFSTQRYVVQIDLKHSSFVPGKKNYERTVKCLTQFVNLQMDFLFAWEPPDGLTDEGLICPSSVAAYLDELGYEVTDCSPKVSSSRQYDVKLPLSTTDHQELLEWLGAVAVGVDLTRNDAEGRYLSSYRGPLETTRESQVAVLKYRGFFTTTQIKRLFAIFREYLNKRKREEVWWAAIHVQGFMDSPVSWCLQEHTFYSDGDNHYTIVVHPDRSLLLFKNITAPKKLKFR